MRHPRKQALLPLEQEDDPLYLCGLAVNQDEALATEMAEWDAVVGDGTISACDTGRMLQT